MDNEKFSHADVSHADVSHADVRHWIHECNRYLFLAKVHLDDPSVHPIIDGDPINYIDKLINVSQIDIEEESHMKFLIDMSEKESTAVLPKEIVNFELDLPNGEISNLKQTFEQISSSTWDDIQLDKIEHAQEILYKLLISVGTAWKSSPI